MMEVTKLSDNAVALWCGFFLLGQKATLTFGGDHAAMEITPEARAALDELILVDAVKPSEPTDSWPGREYYRGTNVDLRPELKRRGFNPITGPFPELVSFRKKESV